MHQTERNYVHELNGLGYKMPVVFVIFTISGLALMGVPGLCGFISKWNLAYAAIASENPLAYAGVAALIVSALLTAIYMMTISVRAFCPGRDFDYRSIAKIKDPGWKMLLPLILFVVAMVVFGLYSTPVLAVFSKVAESIGG